MTTYLYLLNKQITDTSDTDGSTRTYHSVVIHGVSVDGDNKTSMPTKIRVGDNGYMIGDGLRGSSYLDIACGYEDINDAVTFLKGAKLSGDIKIINLTIEQLHDYGIDVDAFDLNANTTLMDYLLTIGTEVLTPDVPPLIVKDIIMPLYLDTVRHGNNLMRVNEADGYWKRESRPPHLRAGVTWALVGDRNNGFKYTRSMNYASDAYISTQGFEATLTACKAIDEKIATSSYTDLLNLFTVPHKSTGDDIIIKVDTNAIFSQTTSRLLSKFGMDAPYLYVDKSHKRTRMDIGKVHDSRTNDFISVSFMERIPDPELEVTRVKLLELYRMAIDVVDAYKTDSKTMGELLKDKIYKQTSNWTVNHVPNYWINTETNAKGKVTQTEVDNLYRKKGHVTEDGLPFIPEIIIPDEQVRKGFLRGGVITCHAVSVEVENKVYSIGVMDNTKYSIAGGSGDIPILLGSRSKARTKLSIRPYDEKDNQWYERIKKEIDNV